MRINHNISSLNTYNKMTVNQNAATKSMEKLSSGQRINRAGDDAAGLAISEKMRGQIRGLEQAATNAQDGISLIQTVEGALNETHAILQRMRELSVQAANDTNTRDDRTQLQNEMHQLSQEITRISNNTTFNDSKLLDGSFEGKKLHIGANKGQNLSIEIGNMNAKSLGVVGTSPAYGLIGGSITIQNDTLVQMKIITSISQSANEATKAEFDNKGNIILTLGTKADGTLGATQNDAVVALRKIGIKANVPSYAANRNFKMQNPTTTYTISSGRIHHRKGIDISTKKNASDAIAIIDNAINTVSNERTKMGAIQNRLEHTINNLSTSAENLTSAESRIRDVDMAKAMMEMTKNNILQQAAQSMLAQANQNPQNILQLLR